MNITQQEAMQTALQALILSNAEWKALADSGDAGHWRAEQQDHYKQTEVAITKLRAALSGAEFASKDDMVRHEAQRLIELATQAGLVVTIERRPLQPLAMGHAEYVIETHEIRKKS